MINIIIESLFNSLISILSWLLTPLKSVSIYFDSNNLDTISTIISNALWFIPIQGLLPILGVFVLINAWKVFVTFWRTLWDSLPIL